MKPLRRATGKTIGEAIESLVLNRWGAPRTFLSDNGTEFANKPLQDLLQGRNIQIMTTPPYTPRCNPVERANRVIKTMISCFIGRNHQEWDEHIAAFQFAVNSSFHEALKTSPAFMNFGRDLQAMRHDGDDAEADLNLVRADIPTWKTRMEYLGEFQRLVRLNIGDEKEKQAHHYNLRRRPVTFEPGHLVLVKARHLSSAAKKFVAKLAPPFEGPCELLRFLSPNLVLVRNLHSGKRQRVSVSDLKSYYPRELEPAET